MFVRFSDAGDFELTFSKGPGINLLLLRQSRVPFADLEPLATELIGTLEELSAADPTDPEALITLAGVRSNWAYMLMSRGLANEAEACAMAGTRDPSAALELLAAHCECVVIRRGARGAVGIAGGIVREVPADPVDVVDTTGAGDCFNAGFLAGWLSGLPVEHSLTLGVICGTGAVTDFGGYRGCPRGADFRAIAAVRGIDVPEVWQPVEGSA